MPSSPLDGKGSPVASKTVERHDTKTKKGGSHFGQTNDNADDAISENADEDEDETESTNDDASDDYIPAAKNTKGYKKATQDKTLDKSTGKRSMKSVSKLEREIKSLSIGGDALVGADDSVIILPNRKLRKAAVEAGGPGTEYVPGKGEVDPAKKKKRWVGRSWYLRCSQP